MGRFSGIIGHTSAQEVLGRMFEKDTLPNGLLFVGPDHVGKTTLIDALIKQMYKTGRPLSSIADVMTLERAIDQKTEKQKSAISVEQIRAFTERLAMSPMIGPWKVGFIKEANTLSTSAGNALLKTLEEPKGKTLLILRAPSVAHVLPTIASRCQTIRLYQVSRDTITRALIERGLTKPLAHEISALSCGRPGLALNYVQDSSAKAQTDTRVQQMLELAQLRLPERFDRVYKLIDKNEPNKTQELNNLLDRWEIVLRDVMLTHAGCRDICVHSIREIDTLATLLSARKLRDCFHRISEVRRAIPSNINAHLSLEHIFLSL